MLVAHSGFFLRPNIMQKYKSSEPGPWAQLMPEILHDHFYIYKLLCPTSFFGYLNYCLLNVSKILILQKWQWFYRHLKLRLAMTLRGSAVSPIDLTGYLFGKLWVIIIRQDIFWESVSWWLFQWISFAEGRVWLLIEWVPFKKRWCVTIIKSWSLFKTQE